MRLFVVLTFLAIAATALAVAWLAGFLAGVNWAQAWAEGVADDGDD